ncbi:MAG: cadherin-like beta sandwich domain-containing protein [Roseburia sp.]|nr:cadherin-like beta sandwich domain-containing protein [Roseburia sp.]
MRLTIKRIKGMMLAAAVVLSVVGPAVNVQAASGKTTIAVSAGEIEVGESVSVTVKAKTDSGNTAKAKMELTYDEDILEFVSCSVDYTGGDGGSVTATASTMTVKFKAVAEGRCPLYVEASNGVESSSGNSLSSVEACSTNIIVNESSGGGSSSGRLSKDNSLKSLSLSAGALSPEFAGNVVNYTATVPGSVTDVEVYAETSNANATIESVAGNTDLQIGANTIKIVVKAENGALATYTIELTREEEEEVVVPTEIETTVTEVVEDTTSEELEEALSQNEYLSNSYQQLEEKYQREKDFSRSVIYVLIFVIAILLVVIINILVYYRRKMDDDFEDSFETKRPAKKRAVKKPAPRPVESKKEEPKKAPAPRAEKPAPRIEKPVQKVEKPTPKAEVRNNFEVFDFNDED